MGSNFPVPRHLRIPGEEGYRTPTIEDAERTISILGNGETPNGIARNFHSTALEAALHKVSSRPANGQDKREYSNCEESHDANIHRTATGSSSSVLGWRKRIRHVTWAFFTLTMATGGLANVLYEGTHSGSGLIPKY